mmetsp:Transcript_12751/g.25972  ORF Transcript_12751/g.25972 Transcript_12751/m.25972 type:complete len:255 (-) Transcript_12751:4101-4865(-)
MSTALLSSPPPPLQPAPCLLPGQYSRGKQRTTRTVCTMDASPSSQTLWTLLLRLLPPLPPLKAALLLPKRSSTQHPACQVCRPAPRPLIPQQSSPSPLPYSSLGSKILGFMCTTYPASELTMWTLPATRHCQDGSSTQRLAPTPLRLVLPRLTLRPTPTFPACWQTPIRTVPTWSTLRPKILLPAPKQMWASSSTSDRSATSTFTQTYTMSTISPIGLSPTQGMSMHFPTGIRIPLAALPQGARLSFPSQPGIA